MPFSEVGEALRGRRFMDFGDLPYQYPGGDGSFLTIKCLRPCQGSHIKVFLNNLMSVSCLKKGFSRSLLNLCGPGYHSIPMEVKCHISSYSSGGSL